MSACSFSLAFLLATFAFVQPSDLSFGPSGCFTSVVTSGSSPSSTTSSPLSVSSILP